jgi:hypothetical protein
MEIPEPTDVPIRRIRSYLSNLRDALLGFRPIAGQNITISEHAGQGTVISTTALDSLAAGISGVTPGVQFTTLTLDVCVDGSPESHTFIVTQ